MIELKGIPTSDGIVIGECYILDRSKLNITRYNIAKSNVDKEKKKLEDAIKKTEEYIKKVKTLSADKLGEDHAFIFDVYLLFLKDDMLIGETYRVIEKELVNAEFALKKVAGSLIKLFEQSDDEYFRERKHDIEQVVQKLLRFMSEAVYETVLNVEEGAIIVAHDLSPSDTVHMIKKNIKAFATDLGGKTSHTSILARSLGITAVVGLEDISFKAATGDIIIVDGIEGKVILDPTTEVLEIYQEKERRYNNYKTELEKLKNVKVRTKDGVNIDLYSNVELNYEINLSNEYNSKGIGLYRTEYIFLEKGDVSEEEQFEILKEAVELNQNKPIIIRTFDLGGEKISESMPHPKEQNPVMGLRAIRYSLRFKKFFKRQLRALLRAAAFGDLRIMVPMISGLEEINQVKSLINEVSNELTNENIKHKKDIKIGIMVELPSLAIITHLIANEVDFFSVGTNDLIQYTLGIDRNNEYVAYLYRPTHPAVLALLEKIKYDADLANIDASVCGEMAGEPLYIPVLLGLGYRKLSMSPASLLKAKMIIRRLDIVDCEELVEKLKRCCIAKNAEEELKKFIEDNAADVYFH